jgi:hypothetical protein
MNVLNNFTITTEDNLRFNETFLATLMFVIDLAWAFSAQFATVDNWIEIFTINILVQSYALSSWKLLSLL